MQTHRLLVPTFQIISTSQYKLSNVAFIAGRGWICKWFEDEVNALLDWCHMKKSLSGIQDYDKIAIRLGRSHRECVMKHWCIKNQKIHIMTDNESSHIKDLTSGPYIPGELDIKNLLVLGR